MNQDQTAEAAAGVERQPFPDAPPAKGPGPRVGGCGRWASYGCVGGAGLLVLFLFASFFTIKKGLLWTAVRGSHQVERKLPAGMAPLERARVMRNFDRLLAELERARDPNPVLGRYLALVARVLEDDQVSFQEVEEVNTFIEAELHADLPPPGEAAPPPSGAVGSGPEPPSSD